MSAEDPWARIQPLARLLAALSHEGTSSRFSRTDALRPLLYPIVAFAAALPLLALAAAPRWLLVAVAAMAGVALFSYLTAFLVGFFRRPDALRSEQYHLARRLADHHVFGDSQGGLVDGELLKTIPNGRGDDDLDEVSGGRL
jgi:hypothetical protein